MKDFTRISINEPFEGPIPATDGFIFEWTLSHPTLYIFMSGMTDAEVMDLRRGVPYAGLLSDNPVAAFMFRFGEITGDGMYHASLYPEDQRPDVSDEVRINDRLLLDVIGVDSASKIVKVIRSVTFQPELTRILFGLVRKQLAEPISRAEYDRHVNDYFRRYPTTASMRKGARVYGKMGE